MNLIFYIYAIIFVSFAKKQGLRSLVLFTYLTWEISQEVEEISIKATLLH